MYLETEYRYDLNNRLVKLTLPGGYAYDYVFDDLGNMTQSTDPNSDDTAFTYDKDNRLSTRTEPNGLVTTNTYDWKTGGTSSVLYERNTTSADDITVSYSYDDNGRPAAITDGRGYAWSKTYDALGRMTALTTPNPGGGAYTHAITYDGNGNMVKTVDFKSTAHYYAYDELNRMTGHGADSSADDETYTYACCGQLTAYTDARGTADIDYDQLQRVTSYTDSNGNNTAYTYDALGRVTTLTPPQGSNYRTAYAYKKNGSLDYVDVYDAGSSARTSYTYSSTSGKLTQRDFPTVSSQNVRTTYSYDSAGRLEYETVTREAGGTTNLYKTGYAYSYIAAGSGGGRQLVRTEQQYSGGAWANDNQLTYKYDALERQWYEQRMDWNAMAYPPAWAARYDITQAYDKNGNRTGYDKNTAAGFTSSYGRSENLGYTFNAVNAITQITDGDDAGYLATVTCDQNGNITEVDEKMDVMNQINHLYTYFTYDNLNRLTEHKTKAYKAASSDWQWTKRVHAYDAVGRLTASTYKQWLNNGTEPQGSSLEHCYAGSRHIQNYDGSNYGAVWHWAGTSNSHNSPLKSPNPDTASQSGYNSADFYTPQRRSFLSPTTEGDKRELYAQGRPQAKDSSGSGANWYLGTKSDRQVILQPDVESRLFFEGTVTATDMSRATDLREDSRLGIIGSALSYRGANGRVASEAIGRDLNPLGRGDGAYYFAGGMAFGGMQPFLPARLGGVLGGGNSSNDSDNWAGGTLPAGPPQSGGSPGSGVGGHGGPLGMGEYHDKPGATEECFPSCTAGRVREPYRTCNGKEQRPNPAFGVKARCCGGPCCQDDVPCLMDWGRGAFETCAAQLGMNVEQAVRAAEKGDMGALAMACKTCPGGGESAIGPGGGVLPVPGCPGGNCGGGGGNYDVFGPMADTGDSRSSSGPIFDVSSNLDTSGYQKSLSDLYWCLFKSNHPLSGALIRALLDTPIIINDFGILPGFGISIPGQPIRFSTIELKRSRCSQMHRVLHELVHQLGKGIEYEYLISLWFWPSPDFWYGKYYGPRNNYADAIAQEIMLTCCCDPEYPDVPLDEFITNGGKDGSESNSTMPGLPPVGHPDWPV